MATFVDYPAFLLVMLLALFIVATVFGSRVMRRLLPLSEEERENFDIVQTATLTLLALLVGFTLSMAVNRYDQRKNAEEVEANAIGTEFARADLLDPAIGAGMKAALVSYTRLRIADFLTRDAQERRRIARDTAALQARMWSMAVQAARDKPTPIVAAVTTGMNDVLNSQDFSEAAHINRIPRGVWLLLIFVAVFSCMVQGYGAKGVITKGMLVTILPATVALSLALIADIDSPRGGVIHVQPENLMRLLASLEK